jgi:hypothetical protein
MLFPQRERRSFTPIQNSRENYSSIYLHLNFPGCKTRRQKILDPLVVGILGVHSALNFFMNAVLIFRVAP